MAGHAFLPLLHQMWRGDEHRYKVALIETPSAISNTPLPHPVLATGVPINAYDLPFPCRQHRQSTTSA